MSGIRPLIGDLSGNRKREILKRMIEERRARSLPFTEGADAIWETDGTEHGRNRDAMSSSFHPVQFSALVVFGDSLSDIGNFSLANSNTSEPPPYVTSRFSNGRLWVEGLADRLGIALSPVLTGGTNFAFAGAMAAGSAGLHCLRGQADRFLRSLPSTGADREALYIVSGGSNDLRNAARASDPMQVIREAVAAIRNIVEDLARAGAIHFLVLNLPNLGRTPEAARHGPAFAGATKAITVMFNKALERDLRAVEASRKIRIYRLDLFRLMEETVADPGAQGFVNVIDPYLVNGTAEDRTVDTNPDGYLFWDNVHLTRSGHAKLMEAAIFAITDQSGGDPSENSNNMPESR